MIELKVLIPWVLFVMALAWGTFNCVMSNKLCKGGEELLDMTKRYNRILFMFRAFLTKRRFGSVCLPYRECAENLDALLKAYNLRVLEPKELSDVSKSEG